MKPGSRILLTLIAASIFFVQPAAAQALVTGEVNGAFYKFVVPPNWNGDLVIFNDGLNLAPIVPFVANPAALFQGLGPLAPVQFSQGFALAATTRRDNGWALFKSNQDLQGMVRAFEKHFRRPSQIIMTGQSAGGLVAIQAIETAHLGNVVGALLMCPALSGSRNWDIALDLRLIYDAVCRDVPGANIPGGAEGLPAGSTLTPAGLAGAVNQCTGILLPPVNRTADQQGRLAKILDLAKIPENFLLTDMGFATFVMSDLVHDPDKLNGRIGIGNWNVDYGDTAINESIQRVLPDASAQRKLRNNYTPSGEIGSTRIVSIHTNKDGLVVVENEDDYASKAPRRNLTQAIAIEDVPSHCGFSAAEAASGWESLRRWLRYGRRPSAADIQSTCLELGPEFAGSCRFIPAIDQRIRPR